MVLFRWNSQSLVILLLTFSPVSLSLLIIISSYTPRSKINLLFKNISQKIPLSVLFLGQIFFKKLGFSLSGHCEWGTSYLSLQKWILN
jgi:hypothetical protein